MGGPKSIQMSVAYNKQLLRQKFAIFDEKLIDEMWTKSQIMEIAKDQKILRVGQYVSVIPIVLSGTVKVYTYHDDKEFLLYYIRENESCIMSYNSCINNEASQIYAITESQAILFLMPSSEVIKWGRVYPEFNTFYLKFYQLRYLDMIETLTHLVFEHLDDRIMVYLKQKALIHKSNSFKITHKEIASDLATTREVVTRIIKKLENENKLEMTGGILKIL